MNCVFEHVIVWILSFWFNLLVAQTHHDPPAYSDGVITCGNSVSGNLADGFVAYEFTMPSSAVTFKTCFSSDDAVVTWLKYVCTSTCGWVNGDGGYFCNKDYGSYSGSDVCVACPTTSNELYTVGNPQLTEGTIYYLELHWFDCCKGTRAYQIDMECAQLQTSDPTTNNPTTSSPTTNAPTTDIPTTNVPTTFRPTTSIPTTAIPTTAIPTTAIPTTSIPTTAGPTTFIPTTNDPTTASPTFFPTTSPNWNENSGLSGEVPQETDSSEKSGGKNAENKSSGNDNFLLLYIGIACLFCIICVTLMIFLKKRNDFKRKEVKQNIEVIKDNIVDKFEFVLDTSPKSQTVTGVQLTEYGNGTAQSENDENENDDDDNDDDGLYTVPSNGQVIVGGDDDDHDIGPVMAEGNDHHMTSMSNDEYDDDDDDAEDDGLYTVLSDQNMTKGGGQTKGNHV